MLLPFNISCSNDQRQTLKSWIRNLVILDDGLEGTSLATMVEIDLSDSRGIIRDCLHAFGEAYKFGFVDKDKLCVQSAG